MSAKKKKKQTECFGEVFCRHKTNPIIDAKDLPYQANAVFNAGAADLGDEVLLLVRVESASGRSHLIVARSADGVTDWRFDKRALLHPSEGELYEEYGCEDCRLTYVDELDCWVIAYVGVGPSGPGVALAKTKDFKTVERLGIVMQPPNKNATLFPCRLDGLYAMLHRPSDGTGNIWISYSPDLIYWGRPERIMEVRGGPWWDGKRIGAGPQPILTSHGWLLIYHGVKEIAGGPVYRMGAALLDPKDPRKVIGRARRWLLDPHEIYERVGDAPNVVFSCGAIRRDNEIWMYYGAADCSLCLAVADIDDIIALIKREDVNGKGPPAP